MRTRRGMREFTLVGENFPASISRGGGWMDGWISNFIPTRFLIPPEDAKNNPTADSPLASDFIGIVLGLCDRRI